MAQIGYTNEYSSLDITVKNQPFTPYFSDTYGDVIYLMYNVRIKPHNESSWVEVYNPYNGYPKQSNSDYTTISFSIEGGMDGPLGSIAGTQSDIQVEALIGYVHRIVFGFGAPWVFNGTESGWSNTQTLSIPANIPLSPTSAPTTSQSPSVTPTLSPSPTIPEFPTQLIVPCLVAATVLGAILIKKRKAV